MIKRTVKIVLNALAMLLVFVTTGFDVPEVLQLNLQ